MDGWTCPKCGRVWANTDPEDDVIDATEAALQALERLGEGWQFEFAFAGSGVELNGRHAQPTRFRARRYEDVAGVK